MRLRFTKENMYTAAGFVYDSFLTDQADFVAVAPSEFGTAFAANLQAARTKIQSATGAALRTAGLAQVTTRLYHRFDAVKPLLDHLDIRLGLLTANDLTVPAKNFGLKYLRRRLDVRDAEAASRALTVLEHAIADNLPALQAKGYAAQELTDLQALHQAIDTDNALQNVHLNASTGATQVEDAAYLALDALLGKVMRTGRLLYKTNRQKRRQYEASAILKRVQAAAQVPAA